MQALSIHWPTQEIRAGLGLPGYQPSRGTETSLAGGWGWKRWMTDRGQYDLECILDIGLKRNRHQKASKTESGSLRGFCCGPGSGRPELSDSCTNGRVVGILPYPDVMCSSCLWSPVDTSTSPSAPMMTSAPMTYISSLGPLGPLPLLVGILERLLSSSTCPCCQPYVSWHNFTVSDSQ